MYTAFFLLCLRDVREYSLYEVVNVSLHEEGGSQRKYCVSITLLNGETLFIFKSGNHIESIRKQLLIRGFIEDYYSKRLISTDQNTGNERNEN